MTQFPNKNKEYDLEERTAKFSEDTIEFLRKIRINEINRNIINQAIRAVTSVGANYCEANAASSRRDFRNKIYICKKEANEAKYWFRILIKSNPEFKDEIKRLWKEAYELNLIFQKITSSIDNNEKV